MAKFLSRLFGCRSSSKDESSPGLFQSITEDNQPSAASLDNLASYDINQKDLEKYKLHKASWEGNMDKVACLAKPDQLNAKD